MNVLCKLLTSSTLNRSSGLSSKKKKKPNVTVAFVMRDLTFILKKECRLSVYVKWKQAEFIHFCFHESIIIFSCCE